MNTIDLRKTFLQSSHGFLEQYVKMANGKAVMACPDEKVRDNVFEVLSKLILQADDPVPIAKLTDGDISERVDSVLQEVSEGNITPDDGKRLIALLQAGFEITELPKLMEKFAELESK